MNVLTPLRAHDLEEEKPFIEQGLERVVAQGFSDYSRDEVYSLLQRGMMDAWRLNDTLVLTQVMMVNGKKVCCLGYGAGDLEDIKKMVEQLEAMATRAGCEEIRILGRRGWSRALPGYEESYTVSKKRLSPWAIS